MSVRRIAVRGKITGLLLLCCLTWGCNKKEKQEPTEPAVSAKVQEKWKVDPALADEFKKLRAACRVDEKDSRVICDKELDRKLISGFLTRERDLVASLETFLALLGSSDRAQQQLVAHVLYASTRSGVGSPQDKIDPAVAREFCRLVRELPLPSATQLVPTASSLVQLTGQEKVLDQVVLERPELGTAVYRFAMVHAGARALPRLQKVVQEGTSKDRLAALAAPKLMKNWTPKDRAEICPWAASLLEDTRPMVAERASSILTKCAGPFTDQLLAFGEGKAASGEFRRGLIPAYRDLCSGTQRRAGSPISEAQCARNRHLLEEVLRDGRTDAQTRGLALSALAYQWPDADVQLLVKKFAEGKTPPELQSAAKNALDRLQRREELRKRAEAPPSRSVSGSAH